jgi:myosin-5
MFRPASSYSMASSTGNAASTAPFSTASFQHGQPAGSGLDDAVAELERGSKAWYRRAPNDWVLAELRERDAVAKTWTVAFVGSGAGKDPSLPLAVPDAQLAPANPELQAEQADLTQLSYLNEPSILHMLADRYGEDAIYTAAGPVLIAVNPCKPCPLLYSPQLVDAYRATAREATHGLAPHIYSVAGSAYRAMVREDEPQSIIINGESGAGKTETTKKAMQFLAALAGGGGGGDSGSNNTNNEHHQAQRVLDTNPILEAFGNAKTLRNHNSSRFGKLIEIHFGAAGPGAAGAQMPRLTGAKVRTYLLEKSRVAHRLPGERSFHIFYQLVRGASAEQSREWGLPEGGPGGWSYLASSGCDTIEGVDDEVDFKAVIDAMEDVGIDEEQRSALFRLVSGVMWLGNLSIEPSDRDDGCKLRRDAALASAARLLGVTDDHLTAAVTTRKIRTPDELIVKLLDAEGARDARDALAKAVYAGLFSWIVARINAALDESARGGGAGGGRGSNKATASSNNNPTTFRRCISILDIYGFEQFGVNSFEQLCINYANERLQQQFSRHLFTLEQQEYEREALEGWERVEWTDNSAALDVIEAAPPRGLGVLSVLDAQCRFPKASDETLLVALKDALAQHGSFGVDPRRPGEFALAHYAGPVSYAAAGFLEKNRDTLSSDLIELMAGSSHPLLAGIGAEAAEGAVAGAAGGVGGGGGGNSGVASGGAGLQTVSTRFSGQLRELVSMLDQGGLHFVRCIKPNTALDPQQGYERALVLAQLRACGVLEVARVSRAGFPTRYPHAQFVERYRTLLSPEQQEALALKKGKGGGNGSSSSSAAEAEALLSSFGVPKGKYEIGRTKVFFRPGVLGYVEDRWAKMQASVVTIQSGVRMWRARKELLRAKAAASALQAAWRGVAVRRAFQEELARHRAAVAVQAAWRARSARSERSRRMHAVRTLQCAVRRRQLNSRVAERSKERLEREAAARAREEELRRAQEGLEAIKAEFGVRDLAEVRAALGSYAAVRDAGLVVGLGIGAAAAGGDRDGDDETTATVDVDATIREMRAAAALKAAVQEEVTRATGDASAALSPEAVQDEVVRALRLAAAIEQRRPSSSPSTPEQLAEAAALGATARSFGVTDADQLQAALALAMAASRARGGITDADEYERLEREEKEQREAREAEAAKRASEAERALAEARDGGEKEKLAAAAAATAAAAAAAAALAVAHKERDALRAEAESLRSAAAAGQGEASADKDRAAQAEAEVARLKEELAQLTAAREADAAQSKQALDEQAAALKAEREAAVREGAEAAAGAKKDPPELLAGREVLGAVREAGIADPQQLRLALAVFAAASSAMGGPTAVDPRAVRRALSMFAAAHASGLGEKRDFMAAASLFSVLKEEGLTRAADVRAAAALYAAVREEGVNDPAQLQAAITAAAAGTSVGGAIAAQHEGLLRATDDGSGDDLARLRQRLVAERAARQRYAAQLEEQAAEFVGQVGALKSCIDGLRRRLNEQAADGPLNAAPPAPPRAPPSALSFGDEAGGASGHQHQDPVAELEALRRKHDEWNGAFEARLRDAEAAVLRQQQGRAGATATLAGVVGAAGKGGPGSAASWGDDASAAAAAQGQQTTPQAQQQRRGLFGRLRGGT